MGVSNDFCLIFLSKVRSTNQVGLQLNLEMDKKVRTILHLDLDAFFCAVEENHHPELRGKAFAVGGRPNQRGVIASCSYPARQYGVRSAMPTARALRLCPELILLPGRHALYRQASEQVMALLAQVSPQIEQISIDEAFLDVSAKDQPVQQLAQDIQTLIHTKLHLPCSIGVASNKLVAKIATDIGKTRSQQAGPPMAITIVPPGQEAAFLAPLPTEALWGVGPKTAERLAEIGVLTVGDLARKPSVELVRLFGKNGMEMWLHAQGQDDRPIVVFQEPKSISQETTFPQDVSERGQLLGTLAELSQQVAQRLNEAQRYAATVKIKIRWPNFSVLTRQISFAQPTRDYDLIYQSAQQLFDQVWRPGKAIRLLGVGVSGLTSAVQQLSFFDLPDSENREKQRRLQEVMQTLRQRYGDHILHPASEMSEHNRKTEYNLATKPNLDQDKRKSDKKS